MIPSSGQKGLSRFESFSSREPLRIAVLERLRLLAVHLLRRLVLAQALVRRRAQAAVVRELRELHLGDELRLDPHDLDPCARAASSEVSETAMSRAEAA